MQQNLILYDLLGVKPDSTTTQIKQAYRTLALKHHPDKNPGDTQAASRFQQLTEAYQTLSDPEKRRAYDLTGFTGKEDQEALFMNAYEYFRSIYKKVESKDIDDYEQNYRESAEEQKDLVQFYLNKKGDLTLLLQNIIGSRNQDIPRFIKFYQQKIASGQLPKFEAFGDCQIKKLKLMKKKKKKEEEFDLVAAIRNKDNRKPQGEPKGKRRP